MAQNFIFTFPFAFFQVLDRAHSLIKLSICPYVTTSYNTPLHPSNLRNDMEQNRRPLSLWALRNAPKLNAGRKNDAHWDNKLIIFFQGA